MEQAQGFGGKVENVGHQAAVPLWAAASVASRSVT
jgi:hypothetical protein